MKNFFKKLFKKNADRGNQIEWYAEYKTDDGHTGRVDEVWMIDIIEQKAMKDGCKSCMWSVMGGEWFDSFQPSMEKEA